MLPDVYIQYKVGYSLFVKQAQNTKSWTFVLFLQKMCKIWNSVETIATHYSRFVANLCMRCVRKLETKNLRIQSLYAECATWQSLVNVVSYVVFFFIFLTLIFNEILSILRNTFRYFKIMSHSLQENFTHF